MNKETCEAFATRLESVGMDAEVLPVGQVGGVQTDWVVLVHFDGDNLAVLTEEIGATEYIKEAEATERSQVDCFKVLWNDATEVLKWAENGNFANPMEMAHELGLRMHGVFEMAAEADLAVPMESEDKWGTFRI